MKKTQQLFDGAHKSVTGREDISPADAPASEIAVLQAVRKLEAEKRPTHAPAIARASNGEFSTNAAYVLLGRLVKRGLLSRQEKTIPLGDITVQRVEYSTTRT